MVDGDSRLTALLAGRDPAGRRPGLAATAIFCVITTYNEFLFALVADLHAPARDGAGRRLDPDRQDPGRVGADGGRRRDRRAADHRSSPSSCSATSCAG